MSIEPSLIFGKFTADTPAFVLKEAMQAIDSPLAENLCGNGEEMFVRRRAATLACQKYTITSKGDLLHFLFPNGDACFGNSGDYMARMTLCQNMCLEDVSEDCSNIPNDRVLWRICSHAGIMMNYKSTREELVYQLQRAKSKRKYVNVQDIPNILSKLDDKEWLMSRVSPSNPEEAICLSAKRFNCNILRAKNPIMVYHALKSGDAQTISKFLPFWENNPHSLSTKHYFVPELSHDFYDRDTLLEMARVYGLKLQDIDSLDKQGIYSLLNDIQRSNNIYPADVCKTKLPASESVVLRGEFMEMQITIPSMISSFEKNKDFVFDGITLTRRHMRQVYYILENRLWAHYPEALPDDWIADRCKLRIILSNIGGIREDLVENRDSASSHQCQDKSNFERAALSSVTRSGETDTYNNMGNYDNEDGHINADDNSDHDSSKDSDNYSESMDQEKIYDMRTDN